MDFSNLRAFLDSYLPLLGIPGSDTVIYKDHEPIFRHTSGYDCIERKTPLREDRIYNIYSCTKIATCVAATQLIERGEILVTDPVYAYFPEYRNIRVAQKDANGNVIDTRAAQKPMLIKHLLTMSSGIDYNLFSPSIRAVQEATGGRAPTQDICAAIASEPLSFDPGEHYQYGLSLDVVAGIVELVSGVRFADYMKQNVFDPLGMKDTAYHIDESKRDRFAAQYEYDEKTGKGKEIPFDRNPYRLGTEFDSGGAGLVSTVDDYVLLMDALANGGVGKNGNRILSERAVALMSMNTFDQKLLNEFAGAPQTVGFGYGYGVRRMVDPAACGSLAPTSMFGWDGAKLCIAFSDPDSRLAFFHAEHMGAFHGIVIPRIRNLVYSCLDY